MNETVLQNALRLRRAGRLSEAAQLYSDILRADPQDFDAMHALALTRYQSGELDQAEQLIAQALLINPRSAEAQYNRGSLLLKLNRLEDAVASFDRALALRPDYPEALGNRGSALMRLDRVDGGLADFEQLSVLKPNLPEAWNNLGGALIKLNRYLEAAESFGKALALRPDYPDARRNRAAVWFKLKNYAAVLSDADCALAFNARNADALEQRADALGELERRDEALASYDRLLAIKPDAVDAHYNRANLLVSLRRLEEAAIGYAAVLRLAPDYNYARGNFVFSKLAICDWQNIEDGIAALAAGLRAEKLVSPPFQALTSAASAPEMYSATRLWSTRGYPAAIDPLWQGEPYRHDRIRLAYLSANFNDHAVARLMAGVFEHHDRRRFETIAISFGRDDKGPLRARLMGAFDRFIDVQNQSAEDIARQLRHLEIDIAVDLMGFTEGSRPGILAFRPAPLQVNYLGYPGSLACDYVDYLLADAAIIPPGEQAYYSEKIVYLPHCYLPGDSSRAIAQHVPSRAEAGLPDSGFVFCCFNNNYKFTPAVFDIWMRLLHNVEGSVLWLSQTNAAATGNLRREAAARGISPERLIFAPFVQGDADHLARLSLADLFLDTLPYNAHATASDALWAGVPVLTVSGKNFAGRVGASLLQAIGMPEMIAPSIEAYETRALDLARTPGALAAVKAKLAQHRATHPPFDTAGFTHHIESAYAEMWNRSQRGLAPQPFAVESSA